MPRNELAVFTGEKKTKALRQDRFILLLYDSSVIMIMNVLLFSYRFVKRKTLCHQVWFIL